MHMEYRVTQPGYDWVIASQHNLISSVYAVIEGRKDGLGKPMIVGYSGSIYIAIRSGKHSLSNALTHALNFNKQHDLNEFRDFAKNGPFVKPVAVLIVDGGPDENPHYQKLLFIFIVIKYSYGFGSIYIPY